MPAAHSIMRTILVLIPVAFIAAFAMYLQYRMLSAERKRNPIWRIMCVLPVLVVGVLLLWMALRA
jgi:uncharacterized membrane-anchored protein